MPLLNGKSKKSFGKNVETEMKAGKPHDQALAIAYEVQRKNRKKMYKGGELSANEYMKPDADSKTMREMEMLRGASTKHEQDNNFHDESAPNVDRDNMSKMQARKLARGGEVNFHDEDMTNIDDAHTDRDEDMLLGAKTSHMMEKRAGTKMASADDMDDVEDDMLHMAEGGEVEPMDVVDSIMARRSKLKEGQVDLGRNSDEDLNYEDQLSYNVGHRDNFQPELKELYQPEDSNLKGDSREEDSENENDMIEKMRARIKAKRGM